MVTNDTNDQGYSNHKVYDFASYVQTLEATTSNSSSFISIQHDYVDDTVQTLVPQVIDYVRQNGYQFVTISECLGDYVSYN